MTELHVERAIRGDVAVDATVDQVWKAWTTEDGVTSFFAPGCNIELRVNGLYEIFFAPDAVPGMRGADDMRILAIQERRMLSFSWNAPPSLPKVRGQRTHVTIRLAEEGPGRTRVRLWHDGWGDGGEWDDAFDYFTRAWNDIVLPRLVERFRTGPVDWDALG